MSERTDFPRFGNAILSHTNAQLKCSLPNIEWLCLHRLERAQHVYAFNVQTDQIRHTIHISAFLVSFFPFAEIAFMYKVIIRMDRATGPQSGFDNNRIIFSLLESRKIEFWMSEEKAMFGILLYLRLYWCFRVVPAVAESPIFVYTLSFLYTLCILWGSCKMHRCAGQ